MTYTNIRLFTANGIPEALSNLWYGTDCSVVEIQDAIEDAENAADLLRRIQRMKLLRRLLSTGKPSRGCGSRPRIAGKIQATSKSASKPDG